MEEINIPQGTPEWHEHRAKYRNASEAPAALNHSPYVKRNELIHMIKTGDKKAFSDYVQRYILDTGHRFEALARPLAEEIIDDDLAPKVGVVGKYSASFDGLNFDNSVGFEHKTLNKAIREAESIDDLPTYYPEQMEHQAMVGGCEKVLFLATRWEECGEDDAEDGAVYGYAPNEKGVMTRYKLAEEKHFIYYPDLELRARIVAAWDQLEKDVDAYEPPIIESAPRAAEINSLPAIVVTGNTIPDKSARDSYAAIAKAMLATTQKVPDNEQEAGDLLVYVEKVTEGEKAIKALVEQTNVSETDRDAFRKWLVDMQKALAKGRIDGGKNLEAFKSNQKTKMVNAAAQALSEHISDLNSALPRPFMPMLNADFWPVLKGKSNPKNMQNDIDAALAEKKIEAETIAKTIGANLASFEQLAVGDDSSLFDDLDVLCLKDADSFTAIVKTRIAEHKEAEAVRIAQQKADDQASCDADQAESKSACADVPAATADCVAPHAAAETAVAQPIRKPYPTSSEQSHAALSLVSAEPDLRASIIADMETMTAEEIKQMAHMRDRILQQRQPAAA